MDFMITQATLLLCLLTWVEGLGQQQGFAQQQQQISYGQQNNYQQATRQQPESFNGQNDVGPPEPYDFNYEVKDELGNTHYRQEQGDQNGNVYGGYGYTNANGLFRYVEYRSDTSGFTATIHTNEPGTYAANPADVVLNVEQPPAGIQNQYTQGTSGGGYQTAQQQSFGGQYQTGRGSDGFTKPKAPRGPVNFQSIGGSSKSAAKYNGYA
ncbi:uncharacterized protein LOC143229292 [Tachypleus tridentatus]|uniref:uncharacterized protein LOC143229292 n=1 Tax=Tachypleus tridentatus TaxID=6853 RepID=UPI003FD38235